MRGAAFYPLGGHGIVTGGQAGPGAALRRLRVVLVEPAHPGNVGAVARAMKTMGLADLVLVAPERFPDPQAGWRAAGGADVLAGARVVADLDAAIGDCVCVAATSARPRRIPWPVVSAREAAPRLLEPAAHGPVAILFGREASGLTNSELQRARFHIHIPANEAYPVLNLAMSVQLIAWEARMAALGDVDLEVWDRPPAAAADVERMLEHLEATLVDIGYLDPDNPRRTMTRLRRLFMRTGLDVTETQMLRGIFKRIGQRGAGTSGR